MAPKFYISTSIPYVNGEPHIGHAQEFVITDVLARYYRAMGYDTYFLTGSDDNAQKNAQVAESEGLPTKEFVDRNSRAFAAVGETLNLSYDQFFQTSQAQHFQGAQKLWSMFNKADIFKKTYTGLYCVGCEQFYKSEDLLDGQICPDHKKVVETIEEENYFFRLANYQDILKQKILSNELLITPQKRRNETLSWLSQELEDLSISRPTARVKGWGVPLPEDPTHTMYVWVDALSNYITALGFGNADDTLYRKYWPADLHVIGKGINRFHTIYWPAFLLSAGLPLPKEILIHDYVTVEGDKISKSLGNGTPPQDLTSIYGIDAVRYYLISQIPTFSDGDYSTHHMQEVYASDLANNLGNLVSRTVSMIDKYLDSQIPSQPQTNIAATNQDYIDAAIQSLALLSIESDPGNGEYDKAFRQRRLSDAIHLVMDKVTHCNQFINTVEPWKLAKTDPDRLPEVLYWLVYTLHNIAWELYPFMPDTAQRIATALGIDALLQDSPNIFHGLHEWHPSHVTATKALFPRLPQGSATP
jgi:methionyl-tRNA synthetase